MKRNRAITFAGCLAGTFIFGANGLTAFADPIDDLPATRREASDDSSSQRSRTDAQSSDRERDRIRTSENTTRSDRRRTTDRTQARSDRERNQGPIGLYLADDGEY